MLDRGDLRPGELQVRLRATAHDKDLLPLIEEQRLQDVVRLLPSLSYREALFEMMHADGLLVLQASNCNEQVPAKVYEYIRCRRPIIGLTDPAGDTAALLRSVGVHHIARLDSIDGIATALRQFLDAVRCNTAPVPSDVAVQGASRLERTRELATLLDRLPNSVDVGRHGVRGSGS
jgi:hypothetical protein